MVALANGSSRRAADVRKGDVVAAFGGGRAKISCVIRTRIPSKRLPLVQLSENGPLLTAFHPIHVDGKWCFPVDLGILSDTDCDAVFSFVLEPEGDLHRCLERTSTSAVFVNGIPCICLGHGLQDDVARHPFFGCRRAIERSLESFPGYESGLVDVGPALRDPDSGLVCGFSAP